MPEIETARLRMRPFKQDDCEELYHISNDPVVRKYLWDDQPVSKPMAESTLLASLELFATRGLGLWALLQKQTRRSKKGDQTMLGFCGLRPAESLPEIEMLYAIRSEHCGQGLATEAAQAILTYAFENLGLTTVVALANPNNTASWRVMQKAGMTYEKLVRHHGENLVCYKVTPEEFERRDAVYIFRRS